MLINELLKTIREHYQEAGLDQLEDWLGKLSMEFAWISEQMAECAKNRAIKEIEIKKQIITENKKPTETEVERIYNATEEGQYYLYHKHYLKAIGTVLGFVKFRVKSLRGEI